MTRSALGRPLSVTDDGEVDVVGLVLPCFGVDIRGGGLFGGVIFGGDVGGGLLDEGDQTITELLVGKADFEFSNVVPEVGSGQNTFSPKLKKFCRG